MPTIYQNETQEDVKRRQQKNYDELLSFAPQLEAIMKSSNDVKFQDFLQWMVDVYAYDQCGRTRNKTWLQRSETMLVDDQK